jgi:penicillin-binding protein 1A
MRDDGYISAADADNAKKQPLVVAQRSSGTHVFAGEYFAEEVRREILEKYGEKKLYEGGLSVRATLDPKIQVMARTAFTDGLIKFDEAQGYRGPVTKIDVAGDWGPKLADVRALTDVGQWKLAVVLDVNDQSARIGFQPAREPGGVVVRDRKIGNIPLDGVRWAKAAAGPDRNKAVTRVNAVLAVGDVVYVDPLAKDQTQFRLRQIPEISGAMVAMDPNTGRVLAIVGGFSFDQSQFDRATQAMRQPGSSFKPLVYAAALDNGYTPSTIVMDAPIEIDQGPGMPPWRPENYSTGKYYGPQTLRFGIEHSRNIMTVRLAQDIGMPLIGEYARRFGVYDNLPHYLSYALGAGETTVMRMVAAYSMFANGGRRVTPTMIDRIQDRYGRTIFRHDQRECRGCAAAAWQNQAEPQLVDRREQLIDPMTAYQITSIMEGVVQRGTGTVVREVGKPVAGKTGTTNDEKDVWFIGFTPEIAVGVYLGYDKPRQIGRGATGGHLAAPIVRDFLKLALANRPAVPFRVPPGIKLIRVDAKSGMRAGSGQAAILEAFKPGTAPADGNYYVSNDGSPMAVSPEADRAVRTGSGLY